MRQETSRAATALNLPWLLMALSATAVAVYAAMNLLLPSLRPGFVQNLFAQSSLAITAHLFGGMLAIFVGALQLNSYLRHRYLLLHRWLGRIYVLAVALSGCAGLVLAVDASGGGLARWGFGSMAVAWLFTTAVAYRQITQGRVESHREWMIRSYAVTLAGATLRLYLGLSVLLGLRFIDVYPVLAWISWVPNLLIAQLYLSTRSAPAASD